MSSNVEFPDFPFQYKRYTVLLHYMKTTVPAQRVRKSYTTQYVSEIEYPHPG